MRSYSHPECSLAKRIIRVGLGKRGVWSRRICGQEGELPKRRATESRTDLSKGGSLGTGKAYPVADPSAAAVNVDFNA